MHALSAGDTAWVLASAALVMLMTPAVGFFYGGLVRRKNALATLMHSFFIVCLISVQWALWGYTLAFGPDANFLGYFHGLIGGLQWLGLQGVGAAPGPYASTIPHLAFCIFQMMFAVITPALISGGFAERKHFKAFVIFTLLWATLVYDPVAHWVWGQGGWLNKLGKSPAFVPIEALADIADIVIECAPSRLVRAIVAPVVSRGKTAVVLSVGALLENEDLIALARDNGGQIVVPTGALIGLDAVTAAAVGTIRSVRMITRKPVGGLAGAPYLLEHKIDIEGITAPLKVFEGTARQAAKGFPANLNVAVALSLAGVGADRTMVEIWADPALTRNVHRIEVEADSARFSMAIENVPSENPRTGLITALSVIACLRKLHAPLRIGT